MGGHRGRSWRQSSRRRPPRSPSAAAGTPGPTCPPRAFTPHDSESGRPAPVCAPGTCADPARPPGSGAGQARSHATHVQSTPTPPSGPPRLHCRRRLYHRGKSVTAASVSRQTVCHGGLNVRRSCLGGSCVTAVTVTAAGISRRRACCGGEVPGRAGGGECVTAASASRRLESHGGDCVRAASESGRRVHYSACQRPCRCWPVTTAV